MRHLVFSMALMLTAVSSAADLKSTFKQLNENRKGAFALNMLQGSLGRSEVTAGGPPGTFQFQAAFRNDIAWTLANQNDFYVGNLFSTNYYNLMGEFVFGDAMASHDLNHLALLEVSDKALPKASSMVRHWLLEKYYVSIFPNTALARGFRLRGISGSEFEQEYAVYFFNFYLSSIQEETAFLPVFLLSKGSPISNSNSLERARVQIAAAYDSLKLAFGENNSDPSLRELYELRNMVHNQLSQAAIDAFSNYMRKYPEVASQDSRISEVQTLLRDYYSVSAKKFLTWPRRRGSQNCKPQLMPFKKMQSVPLCF